MGDYIDFARTTARRYLRAYAGDETSLRPLDKIALDCERELVAKHLRKIAPRCLGIIEGNHTWITDSGVSTGQRLSEVLDCPYLYDMGGISLTVATKSKTLRTFRLLAHHGDFGGNVTTPGGDLNAMVNRGGSWLVDINFFAHSHKRLSFAAPMLTWATRGKLEIEEVPHLYVRTGGFQRAYRECDERGRYGETKMLKPSELGYVTAKVRFFQEYDREKYRATPGNKNGKIKYRIKCTS